MREILTHSLGNVINHYWKTHTAVEITINVAEAIAAYYIICIVAFAIWIIATGKGRIDG